MFDVQLEVARIVTSTITGRLTALAGEARAVKAPDSFDAYDHVLRAQQYLQQYTRSDYARAREHLEAAIRADPSYARPHGLLCLAGVYEWFWQMSDNGLADVLAIGEKALSLDEHDPKTHLALGIAHLFFRHHDRAVHHLERAMTLNPERRSDRVEHGRLLMYLDRPEDGCASERPCGSIPITRTGTELRRSLSAKCRAIRRSDHRFRAQMYHSSGQAYLLRATLCAATTTAPPIISVPLARDAS
jgi:tetratricopeptide (TPR) repeat protein